MYKVAVLWGNIIYIQLCLYTCPWQSLANRVKDLFSFLVIFTVKIICCGGKICWAYNSTLESLETVVQFYPELRSKL